jgi:hypothetical protein
VDIGLYDGGGMPLRERSWTPRDGVVIVPAGTAQLALRLYDPGEQLTWLLSVNGRRETCDYDIGDWQACLREVRVLLVAEISGRVLQRLLCGPHAQQLVAGMGVRSGVLHDLRRPEDIPEWREAPGGTT